MHWWIWAKSGIDQRVFRRLAIGVGFCLGTSYGLVCEAPGLDLVVSGYSALACDLTKEDLSKIAPKKQDLKLLNSTKILLDSLSQKIVLIIDLEKFSYPFKERYFGDQQWGFKTNALQAVSLMGHTYQSHLASAIRAKDENKARKMTRLQSVIVLSKGSSNKAIIFPAQKGIVLGDVYFAEGDEINKIGNALPNKFVFTSKPSMMTSEGRQLLTHTGRAAQFLGLDYQ